MGSWASVSSSVKSDLIFLVLQNLQLGSGLEFLLWLLRSPLSLKGGNVGLGEILMQKEFSLWWSVWFRCIWPGSLMWRWASSFPSYWGQLWLARSAKYRLSSRTPCLSPSPTSFSGLRAPGYRDPRSLMWGESGLSPAPALFCLPDCPGCHTASSLGQDRSARTQYSSLEPASSAS